MRSILFPTDFSENSLTAYAYALDIASLFEAKLIILNTYKLPYSKSNVMVSMTDIMKQDSEKGLEELKHKALSNPKYKGLDIQLEIVSGNFVSSIQKLSKLCKADLIVMGTKGASSLKEMLIGSNTLEVIQTTHCPILAVPENAGNSKIDKIAMAVDLKKVNNPEQLRPLLSMAAICRASIEFVHVMHPESNDSAEERFQQIVFLEDFASEINSNINIITNKDVIDGLDRYMEEEKPGMLAMLTRKHSLFERLFTQSITNRLSFRSNLPLLIMDE